MLVLLEYNYHYDSQETLQNNKPGVVIITYTIILIP